MDDVRIEKKKEKHKEDVVGRLVPIRSCEEGYRGSKAMFVVYSSLFRDRPGSLVGGVRNCDELP